MAVSQRGNSWQAYIKFGSQRIRRSFQTKEDADVWEALARQALKAGKPVPDAAAKGSKASSSTYTFSAAAEQTYQMFWKGSKSEETQIGTIAQLTKYFGAKYPMANFTTEVVDDLILDLKKQGNAGSTINRKLACLSKIVRFAHDRKHVAMPKFHRQKEPQHRLRWLTKEEETAIMVELEVREHWDILAAAKVAIDTGIRAGELLKIRAKDVNAQGLYVGLTKSGNPRLVPLTKRARQILENRNRANTTSLLFPYQDEWYRYHFDKVTEALGFDDVVWHTFRHTTCSRLVQGGAPLVHIKEWMGHEAIQTTMRYAHLAPTHLREMLHVLE